MDIGGAERAHDPDDEGFVDGVEPALEGRRHVKARPAPVSQDELALEQAISPAGQRDNEHVAGSVWGADDNCGSDLCPRQVLEGIAHEDNGIP